MTELRKEILTSIERNGRVDLEELAVLLGSDKVTVANEMARMEKEKIICGYHTMIDWSKVGEDFVNALIEVSLAPQRESGYNKLAERICNYPEVSAVFLISGDYDLLVSLEGKSLLAISRFVSEKLAPIDGVVGTATHFVLKKYKDHGTCLFENEKAERMLVSP